jgi:cellulose synthase/poly-beta-1,6-N-acetylglucosamine synthase-like glycosyltransferase
MRFLFFFSLFMIFYVHLGYPMLISLIGLIRNKKVKKAPIQPSVTILIAAYNEERDIEKTIKNKLDLDHPKEKLEIIVISDGSTDKTDEIVRRYEGEAVRLIRQEPRAGKTSALNMAVPLAKGEIIAFSDANSLWQKSALLNLVQNFNDPSVGYVSGKMVYTNPDGSMVGDGCTAYMKYENQLREFETRIGSVVGVDGGIDAIRKNLYQHMNPDQLPDFVLPLKVVQQGYRVVYEPEAILREASLKDSKDEYRMRVRVSLRALWALWDMRSLLTFGLVSTPSHVPTLLNRPSHLPTFSHPLLFAWQLWSHKVLRYGCFLFLIGAYLLNLTLWPVGGVYKVLFAAQNLAYLFAALYPLLHKVWEPLRGLYFLNYFLLLNLAAGHAFVKFLMGQKQVIWTPRKG